MKLSTLVFGGLIGYSAASVAKVRASQSVNESLVPGMESIDGLSTVHGVNNLSSKI